MPTEKTAEGIRLFHADALGSSLSLSIKHCVPLGLTLAARPFKLEFQNAMASYFAVFFTSE